MSNQTEKLNQEMQSAYEKANAGEVDPRCVPIRPEEPLPVGEAIDYPDYDASHHQTWQSLYERQVEILPGRAAKDFLRGMYQMDFPKDHIPALSDLSTTLKKVSQWQVARTPGLLHEEVFFNYLAERIFPSTDYIRETHELNYTPAPDCFHDMFGHMPILCEPDFADFYQDYGKVALQAKGADRRRLERFYWFTAEFGLIQEEGQLRIYGNGILSSYEETFHSISEQVQHLPFDPFVMAEQEYDVWHMQPLLFVIESYEQLKQGFRDLAQSMGIKV